MKVDSTTCIALDQMPDLDRPRWTLFSPVIEKACQGVARLPCSRVWAARWRYRIWLRSLLEVNGSHWRYRPWRRKWTPKHWRRDWPAKATRSQPARPPPASLSLPREQGSSPLLLLLMSRLEEGRSSAKYVVRPAAASFAAAAAAALALSSAQTSTPSSHHGPQDTHPERPPPAPNATNALHVKSQH